ncbi:hypothetical protein TrVE_jg1597 [Triparma verrucosa]|uniref:FCP1 homology domain-containing protein n=1 Tax=Triparma verrucosa TaxID=1606542 RepID=A0A9W7F1J7_9STRA|nr:hypothetical protein TrVE_jg1597 [Triparma verrucosa]
MSSFTVPIAADMIDPSQPTPSTTSTTSTTNTNTTSTSTTSPSQSQSYADSEITPTHTLIAKWSKQRLSFSMTRTMTIYNLKTLITGRTNILQHRQKLIGLSPLQGGQVTDETKVEELKVKKRKKTDDTPSTGSTTVLEFILMGTPESDIFIDPSDCPDLPDVVDDFGFDFNAGGEEWVRQITNSTNLQKYIKSTEIFMINPLRPKPLLVLDLDHTLLDFSRKTLENGGEPGSLKRPYMDFFLTSLYPYYDLCIWSQTSWRWLEVKLTELGMISNPGYKIAFVLDKTSMFRVESTKPDGTIFEHHVKPLQLIWSKLGESKYGPHNTVHVDDLSRNFALNKSCGLKCTAYYRKKKAAKGDVELRDMAVYLVKLAGIEDFEMVEHGEWMKVVEGKKDISGGEKKKS